MVGHRKVLFGLRTDLPALRRPEALSGGLVRMSRFAGQAAVLTYAGSWVADERAGPGALCPGEQGTAPAYPWCVGAITLRGFCELTCIKEARIGLAYVGYYQPREAPGVARNNPRGTYDERHYIHRDHHNPAS